MKKLHLSIFGILCLWLVEAQSQERFTISGYVKESHSGELLLGVNIYLPELNLGTTSNNYGFYSITIPARDSISLQYSFIGFDSQSHKISLRNNQELNIWLGGQVQLNEVIVNSQAKDKESESVRMSTINIPVAQIKNIPSLLGEKDVLKVLQLMPGVQKGGEGSSGIYVRGGGPDQNLIILDDATVYNVSHLFGFFSIFNGDALKSVELTKGGFPARYGGRLSSVVEMNMKEGNKEKWHGEGGIGIIASRLTLEGPLKKGKSSILLSGRRTYIDLVLYPLMNKKEGTGGYFFYDFNAKINYDFGRNNKLYLSGYFGRDKFYIKDDNSNVKEDGGFYWGNATGTLRWNHLYSNRLFSNASLIYSNYKFSIYDKYTDKNENKDFYAEYYSGIRDFTFKYDVDFLPNPKNWIKAGVMSTFHRFYPYALISDDIPNEIYNHDVRTTDGLESAVYIEDTWQPVQSLKMNGGIRLSHFLATKQQYYFIEPRLSVAWRLQSDFALKCSYASMNQYIHLISNTGISLPTDLWVPTTDRVKPQMSRQIAAGLVKDFEKPNLTLSLEGYYKAMFHLLSYKEGASFLALDDPQSSSYVSWEDNVTSGRGWSYGMELLIQKKVGKLSGWIGYTLSWTQVQFDSINFGKTYNAHYDRRHDISIVGIYKITDRITLSATWVFGTGNAITMPVSVYNPNVQGHDVLHGYPYEVNDYGDKNSFRMEPYHRLDIGIQFHKKTKWGERTWEISVYNVYNRKNPYFYTTDTEIKNGKEYGYLKKYSLFPIIPSITYSFKF